MARKLKDLEDFIKVLAEHGYFKEITLNRLKYLIAKKYGYSDFVQKSIINALINYGFIYEIRSGIYEITMNKTETEIEKEADEVLDGKIKSTNGKN